MRPHVTPDTAYGDLVTIEQDGWLPNDAAHTEVPRVGHRVRAWRCACVCGAVVRVRSNHLLSGEIRSCGCRAALAGFARRSDLDGLSVGASTVTEGGRGDTIELRCRCGATYTAPRSRVVERRRNTERGSLCPACGTAKVEVGRTVRGWTVVERDPVSGTRGEARWRLRCNGCGAACVRYGHHLRAGRIAPCEECAP